MPASIGGGPHQDTVEAMQPPPLRFRWEKISADKEFGFTIYTHRARVISGWLVRCSYRSYPNTSICFAPDPDGSWGAEAFVEPVVRRPDERPELG